ncbi:MAG: glycosyltransferase [Deltaproteobacteria bacterium]
MRYADWVNRVADRLPRIAVFSEARIPSAILGVDAIVQELADEHACEFRACSSVQVDAADIAWADSLVLVRGASPAELRLLIEAQRLGRLVATYMDDDLERVPAEARSGYFFTAALVRQNLAEILQRADAVFTPAETLATRLADRHSIDTTILRQPRPETPATTPPPTSEHPQPRVPAQAPSGAPPHLPLEPRLPAGDDSPVRIAFLGSVDHTSFLEELLAAPLRALRERYGNRIDLLFCGALPNFAAELGATRVPYEMDFHAWRERAAALKIDIGLAPIAASEFHRAKYWNKYLEYGSLGIAGLYSAGSANAEVVRHGETGLVLPGQSAAWEEALIRLIENPELCQTIATAARRDVEARFSARALRGEWARALAPLLSHRAPATPAQEVRLPTSRLRHLRDRLAIYGPARATERALNRLRRK